MRRTIAMAVVATSLNWSGAAAAQTGLCDDPGGVCGASLSAGCLERLGAGVVSAADGDCKAQVSRYRDCLARAAEECGGAAPLAQSGGCDSATALALWSSAEADDDCLGYAAFRQACPNSAQARFVESRFQRLGCGDAGGMASPIAVESDAKAAQRELQRLGRYSGPIDGDWNATSQQAMRQFKKDVGMVPVNGALSPVGLEALMLTPTP